MGRPARGAPPAYASEACKHLAMQKRITIAPSDLEHEAHLVGRRPARASTRLLPLVLVLQPAVGLICRTEPQAAHNQPPVICLLLLNSHSPANFIGFIVHKTRLVLLIFDRE